MATWRQDAKLWTLALVLLASLPVLGWLQYRWLGQLHAAESQRLAAGLQSGLEHFARDFDREMGDLFVVFQTPGPRLAKAYASWADHTAFPGLLREVWTASSGSTTAERWSRFIPGGPLELASLPSEIAEIVSRVAAPGTLIVEPLDDERWVLLVPQPPSVFATSPSLASRGRMSTPASGFVLFESFPSPNVIVLDRHYAISEMVGRLATQHFPSTAEGFDYAVLRSRDEAEEELMASSSPSLRLRELSPPDGEVPLLEASGLNASTILNNRLTSLEATLGSLSSEFQTSEFQSLDTDSIDEASALTCSNIGFGPQWLPVDIPEAFSSPASSMSFMLARGSQFGSRWTLRIRHRAGSLEAALEQARRGNLFLGLLILVILASSLVLLIVLVLRSQRLARQQMDFVAGVSHEFRTPLAVIGSAAGNLADGVVQTSDQVRTYGDLLRVESRRLTDLVERVLTFASTDSRKLEARPVDVADVVRRVLDDLRRTLEEEGVTVEREIPADLPAALADPAALETALQNLISNAVKYGEDGRWIGIEARSEVGPKGRPEIGLTVRDRGPGIDPEDRSHIFEPFYRGRRARDAQIPGSGLGLSLVERLVRNLGGRISLEAPARLGTALTLHLPALEAESR